MPHENTEDFDAQDVAADTDDGDGSGGTAPQPANGAPKPRTPRPRAKTGGIGMGAANAPVLPENPEWHYQEAEALWPEVLQEAKRRGKSAYDLVCRVSRLVPEKVQLGPGFECSAIQGDDNTTPGDALINYVTDNIHMPLTQGPMQYDVAFVWKLGARIWARGKLSLPSTQEILAIRRATAQNQMPKLPSAQAQMPQGPPNMPWQQPPYAAPMQQPYGVGAVPQQPPQQQQGDPSMLMELAYLRGTLSEALAAAREGRAPVIAPPPAAVGVGAPPPASAADARIDRLEKLVERLIDINLPKTGVAAPPQPATPPQEVAAQAANTVGGFKQFVDQVRQFKTLGAQLDEVFGRGGRGGDDDDDDPPPAAPTPVVETKKEDVIPFDVQEVPGAKWSNGAPVQFARDKETGNIDWLGAAFANPHAAEKVMEFGSKIGEGLGKVLQRFAGNGLQEPPVGVAAPQAPPQMSSPPAPKPPDDGSGQQGGGMPSF